MKICIYGAGAIGSYLASALDKAGEDVSLIARGATLEALRNQEKEAQKQLSRMEMMHPDSSEATIIRTYIDWILDIPWHKSTTDRLDLVEAKLVLDEDHYGLEKVKERILEYLAVRKLNESTKGPILCFVGPPGVGKTSLAKSIGRALGRTGPRPRCSGGRAAGQRGSANVSGLRRIIAP